MKTTKAPKLDIRSMVGTSIGHFLPWLVVVLLITWSGYPGVVCITPMAWLLALSTGTVCSLHSRSQKSSTRLLEAALAGGILGLFHGILFMVIVPVMGPIEPGEEASRMTLILFMLLVGILISASLSLFSAVSAERRKKREVNLRMYESIMRDMGM